VEHKGMSQPRLWRFLAAVLSVLVVEPLCLAGQKMKIEVVEATRDVALLGGPKAGTPEKKETRCTTGEKDGKKTEECTTVTTPAVPPSNDPVEMDVMFSAKIILPDGTHALLLCSEGSKDCGEIQSATPERTKETWNGASKTVTGLGMFESKRNNDEIVIYTPRGKRKYQITGSW
jgi:hypothetical protein